MDTANSRIILALDRILVRKTGCGAFSLLTAAVSLLRSRVRVRLVDRDNLKLGELSDSFDSVEPSEPARFPPSARDQCKQRQGVSKILALQERSGIERKSAYPWGICAESCTVLPLMWHMPLSMPDARRMPRAMSFVNTAAASPSDNRQPVSAK